MPSSQMAATERRNNDRTITHEPPKLKTTLKTPPKQATNPLQFVKVGPCSLYRTAQEQLQKVQEVKKIKQEIRDDPEDWQSNLDNWKSSRRKRQEHIIERVVEVKKLELEEHDRQRRRSKTFSEMMEERGHRGRKLSFSLALYNEEDANDLSDLGIGTSSGKSSVSGDTHDDTHSVLSDRDSEIDKNHSDVDNTSHENGNDNSNGLNSSSASTSTITTSNTTMTTTTSSPLKKETLNNGFHKNGSSNNQEYDSATTATASSPEPEEYTYEGAIRGYVSRVSQNIPRRSLADLDAKLDNANKSAFLLSKTSVSESSLKTLMSNREEKSNGLSTTPVVKVDILKRREIFEKASRENIENKKNNNNSRLDLSSTKSIKERLSSLERQKIENDNIAEKIGKSPRHSIDLTASSIRDRFREKQSTEKELKTRDLVTEELESVKPLRERLTSLEKFTGNDQGYTAINPSVQHNGELNAKSIKDRLISLDSNRCKETEKRSFHEQTNSRVENLTPSERSSSPDSEYRAPRATFHQSLDSLDADASSGPDTFERVQSLEKLDYHQTRRYPASTSSAEILNDTDREDSGIHTADASCSVSQADEPIEEEIGNANEKPMQQQIIVEEKTEFRLSIETTLVETSNNFENVEEKTIGVTSEPETCDAVLTEMGTAEISSSSSTSTSGEPLLLSANNGKTEPRTTNANAPHTLESPTSPRTIVYQSPRVPPRRSPPETLPKPKPSLLPVLCSTDVTSPKDDNVSFLESPSEGLSTPDSSSTNTICSLNFSVEPESSKNFQSTTPDQTSSDSMSPINHQDSKCSPLISPRSPSKIPTPLPRKTVAASSGNSTSSLTSPTSSSPSSPKLLLFQKQRNNPPRLSEIPIPVKVTSPTPTSPPTSPRSFIPSPTDARRRTVVEVCEKVVVPRGQALVTPFITVERYADEANGSTEAKQQHQSEQFSQREQGAEEDEEEEVESSTSSSPVSLPLTQQVLDEEEEEAEEEAEEEDEVEEKLQSVAMDSPQLDQDIKIQEVIVDKPQEYTTPLPVNLPPVRPTTLALDSLNICSDFLSPLSPVSKQILPLSFSSDEEIVTGLAFPLGPPTSVEPPKEKPPPPPVDLSDEENHPIEPLKRLNSTRRIKKELRTRRSDFLGIEGFNDDELERELTLTKPPDMAAILAEERRIEQLHRRSYDTDSNYEQDSSHERDSGVELGQAEDWSKQPVSPDMSQHSRQSSEPFGASVTSSEEDEISKKEREIMEVLEREEQWRYENNREINSDIGEKLAHKLRELEEEKLQLERERAAQEAMDKQQQQLRRQHQEPNVETLRMNEENLRKQEELTRKQDEAEAAARQQELENQRIAEEKHQEEEEEESRLQEQLRVQECEEKERRSAEARRHQDMQIRAVEKTVQENKSMSPALSSTEDEYSSREVLRVERELLQLEQEELKRQRSNLAYREQKQQQLAEQLQEQWKSLQDVAQPRQPAYIKPHAAPLNYRSSMPNLQESAALSQRRRPPPPPIPPTKPLRLVDQRQRDVTIRNSRIPSADSIPQQVEAPLRSSCSASNLSNGQHQQIQNHNGQQMSRQTLQALSAVPRPRIVQADQWVQRRKSDIPRGAHDLNYQHWLIQEAEQRRINEKNQRSPARKPHVTGTSIPYTASPPRSDNKPLPDSIIQTLTQRVQSRVQEKSLSPRRRLEHSTSQEHLHTSQHYQMQQHKVHQSSNNPASQEKMLSVSGKKKCSHCGDELGRGAAMIIESLRLFYHMECFKCCVCHVRLGDGLMGTDVRVRNHKLHCHNCYSSDDGVKFSCV